MKACSNYIYHCPVQKPMKTRCCSAPYKCPHAIIWTIRSGSTSAGHREKDSLYPFVQWLKLFTFATNTTHNKPTKNRQNPQQTQHTVYTHTHTHTLIHMHTLPHTQHALDVRLLIKIDEWWRGRRTCCCCWHIHLQIFMEYTHTHTKTTYIYLYIYILIYNET